MLKILKRRIKNIKAKATVRRKVPTIFQMEATECGAACLNMILAYYDKWVALEDLREDCGVSRDGSNLYNISCAANNHGLEAKAFACEIEALYKIDVPAIMHWGFNHFVVLEGIKKGKAYINDPALGPTVVHEKELNEKFTGVILCLKPGKNFVSSGEKKGVIKSLRTRFSGMLSAFYFLLINGLALLITGAIIPSLIQVFIDSVLIEKKIDWLIPIIVFILGTGMVKLILVWLREMILQRMELKLVLSMYSKYFWHLLRLPSEFFSRRYTGDIIYRMSSNEILSKILGENLIKFVLDVFMAIFYLVIMLKYSVPLTIISLCTVIVNLFFILYMSKKKELINIRLMEYTGKMLGMSSEGLATIEVIKSNAQEQEFFCRWSGVFTKLANGKRKMDTTTNVMMLVPDLLGALSFTSILILGSFLVIDNKMSIGMLMAFQALVSAFTEPITRFSHNIGEMIKVKSDLLRLDDVLNYPQDILNNDSDNTQKAMGTIHKLDGRVTLKDVTYGYSRLDPAILKELSFDIKPGSIVAIVGASGNGKSTISKIIAGIEQPWSGEVLLDNINIKEIDRLVLSSSVVLVEQNIQVFEGTIRDNLTMWDTSIPYETIVESTKDALVYDSIMSRAKGLDEIIEENGRNFSGGQIQRIELARALVANPKILILDEATSALDPYTEKEIMKKIKKRGCTCVIIAHRLSTIRDCDEIFVIDNGTIAQKGTHDELKNVEGIYKSLTNLEFYR